MTDNGRQEQLEAVAGYLHHAFEREAKLWQRFQENLAAAEQALAEARADPYTAGSTGQLTAHPGFGVAARCDELALKFYRELTAGQEQALANHARGLAKPESPGGRGGPRPRVASNRRGGVLAGRSVPDDDFQESR